MFCRNCGKEVADNAYVCTGCGCLVQDLPKMQESIPSPQIFTPAPQQISPPNEAVTPIQPLQSATFQGISEKNRSGKGSLFLKIFLILSFSLMMLALACYALSLAPPDYGGYITSSSIYFYVTPTEGWCISMLICSFASLGTSIPSLILGIKEKEPSLKLMSILDFIASLIVFALAFLIFVFLS